MTPLDVALPAAGSQALDALLRRRPIGEILVGLGHITAAQRDEALALSRQWDTPFGDVVQSQGFIGSLTFHQALARQLGKRFIDLTRQPPQAGLLRLEELPE